MLPSHYPPSLWNPPPCQLARMSSPLLHPLRPSTPSFVATGVPLLLLLPLLHLHRQLQWALDRCLQVRVSVVSLPECFSVCVFSCCSSCCTCTDRRCGHGLSACRCVSVCCYVCVLCTFLFMHVMQSSQPVCSHADTLTFDMYSSGLQVQCSLLLWMREP